MAAAALALAAGMAHAAPPASPAPAASAVTPAKASAKAPAARVLRDLAYGTDARQKLDVYIPAQPSGPVIFLVHGGEWASGDKAAPEVVKHKLKHYGGKGYVVVSTNYRLLPKAKPLEQAADVGKALALVQQQAASWGADPQRILLMGQASGGHLAMLLNSSPQLMAKAGLKPWRATVALDSSVYDLVETMKAPHPKSYDRAFGTDSAAWEAASPRHVLSAPGAPSLMMLCSRKNGSSCAQALHFERRAATFKHHIVIWEEFMSQADVGSKLGEPGMYTEKVDVWVNSVLKP